jgi:hypothetical protein
LLVAANLAFGIKLDESISSLLGAALGAMITVAGSLWLVGSEATYNSDLFRQLVWDNIVFMNRQAATTRDVLWAAHDQDFEGVAHDDFAAEVTTALHRLLDSAVLFERLTPFAEIKDYEARISLQKLEQVLFDERKSIEQELRWLGGTTRSAY